MAVKLFVYGTLMSAMRNHHLISDAKYMGDASITGVMYSLGGFPFVNTEEYGVVKGEVYEADAGLLTRTDYLEGYHGPRESNFYDRILVPCSLGCDVYVYVQNDRKGKEPVEDGCWRKHEQSKFSRACC